MQPLHQVPTHCLRRIPRTVCLNRPITPTAIRMSMDMDLQLETGMRFPCYIRWRPNTPGMPKERPTQRTRVKENSHSDLVRKGHKFSHNHTSSRSPNRNRNRNYNLNLNHRQHMYITNMHLTTCTRTRDPRATQTQSESINIETGSSPALHLSRESYHHLQDILMQSVRHRPPPGQ